MSESSLQIAVAAVLDQYMREGKLFWYHPPNSIYTSKSQAGKHKAYGMKAGVPDCCIVLMMGRAVYIELKYGKNGLQPAQKTVHAQLNALQAPVFTIRTDNTYDAVRQVREILKDLGVAG